MNLADMQELIESLVANAQQAYGNLIHAQMRQELDRIHRAHFGRHTLQFVDGMGSVCIWLADKRVEDIIERLCGRINEPLMELAELEMWYREMSDLAHVTITDIFMEPIQ